MNVRSSMEILLYSKPLHIISLARFAPDLSVFFLRPGMATCVCVSIFLVATNNNVSLYFLEFMIYKNFYKLMMALH